MPAFIIFTLNHIIKEKEQDCSLYRTGFSFYITWRYWEPIKKIIEIYLLNPGQHALPWQYALPWQCEMAEAGGASLSMSFNFVSFPIAFSRGMKLNSLTCNCTVYSSSWSGGVSQMQNPCFAKSERQDPSTSIMDFLLIRTSCHWPHIILVLKETNIDITQ